MPLKPVEHVPNIPKDSYGSFRSLIEGKERLTILIGIAAVVAVIIGFLIQWDYLVFFGIIGGGLWFTHLRNEATKRFFKHFALLYGFTYFSSADWRSFDSKLFSRGKNRKIWNRLTGTYKNTPIELFQYGYETGSGKNKQKHNYTVCVATFTGPLPPLVIEENSFFGGDGLKDSSYRTLPLPSPFDTHFKAYIAETFHIEAFEVLTPEIMALLTDRAKTYSLEFKGNRLYVIENKNLITVDALRDFMDLTVDFLEQAGPRLTRLHDDVQALKETEARLSK